MSNKDGISAQQERKVALLLEGQLEEADSKQLAEQLAADPNLRSVYLRYATIDAMLRWCHGAVGRESRGDVNPAIIAEMLEEAEQAAQQRVAEEAEARALSEARADQLRCRIAELQRRRVRRPEPIVIPRSVAYVGGAALAVAASWLVFTVFSSLNIERPSASTAVAGQTVPVATLLDSVDLKLVAISADGNGAPRKTESISAVPGTRLMSKRYQLLDGLVEMEFDQGATAILEGPAMFDLRTAGLVRLARGKIVGQVPPRAAGFTVETPTAKIVDLGTEFGVEVAAGSEDLEVHVFAGEVSLASGADASGAAPNQVVGLTAGQAVLVDAQGGGIVRKDTEDDRFVRAMPTTIDYVGFHEGIGRHLASVAVAKEFDADNDNVFGTAGYYFFNSNDELPPVRYVGPFVNMVFRQPSFVESRPGFDYGLAAAPSVYSVEGMPDYLDIFDPRSSAEDAPKSINTGILSYDIQGSHGVGNAQNARVGSEIELCRIALGVGIPDQGFRLGVFADNGDLIETVPGTIRIAINDVSDEVRLRNRNLNGDVYLFDIRRAKPGDELVIYLGVNADYSSIGGLTFDVLPLQLAEPEAEI